MRIISGKFKGRRFNPPADKWPTRPTTDFAKEGLFNILQNTFDFEELKVLDLFGGTGNHSYEFISRGCADVTYVDKFPGCLKFVEQTAKTLDIQPFIKIVSADVFRFIERSVAQYGYIFAGPPYPLPTIDTLPDLIFGKKMLAPGGWFVLEHNAHHDFGQHPRFLQQRNYGGTVFSFFEMPEADANA
ncbi:MAG: RsmD family RNA methyltransferase [Bacteroidetes bacterium]|nr:RsmD family RNA methyltransferase [Bacteroidota bacterium]